MEINREILGSIGERIRQARKEHNMSQLELAEKASISETYISRIELGKSDFSVSVLVRISEALQTSTDKLLRPDIPESQIIAAADLSDLLQDCTPLEATSIIETSQNMKKAFAEAKKNKN